MKEKEKEKGKVTAISTLENTTGILPLLVYLYENQAQGKIKISELKDKTNISWETALKTIKYLKANGLVEEEHTKTFPVKHVVSLTSKGAAVAKHLFDAADALQHL